MEFKHFSHKHGLIFDHMLDGSKIHCSGCKSPGLENAYVCWQCNYFLHEQCFRASRSLKHPSHPLHPLTLAPFPTYSSGSFFCKFCSLGGKGFSYSCSECEFDIHVRCAHIPNPNNSNPRVQNPTYTSQLQNNVFPTNPPYNRTTSNDVQSYPHQPQVASFPPNPNNPLPDSFPPKMTIPNQTQNYASPQTYPSNQNNPIPVFSQPNPNQTQNYTTTHTNTYPPNLNNPIPAFPNSSPLNPTIPNRIQNHSIPHTNTYPQNQNNPIPAFPEPSTHFPKAPNPNPPPQPPPQSYAPANPTTTNPPPPISQPTPVHFPHADNMQTRSPAITKHFSHPHAMKAIEIEQNNAKICSACESQLSGPAYCCTEPYCTFNLHKTCFESPTEIWHKSHHQHPLTLHPAPGYSNGFTCDACQKHGKAFVYNCATCSYDLHINCIKWPETVTRPDHKHNLTLHYSSPIAGANQDSTFVCDVCMNSIDKMAWVYYCRECDFGTHLECVGCEVKQVSTTSIGGKTEADLLRELDEVRICALEMKIRAAGRKAVLELLDDSDSD